MTSFALHHSDREHLAIPGNSRLAALRAAWERHSFIAPSFAICLLVAAWFVTWGDWKFFEHETFCGFYDAQARSLMHGRLDVPPKAIGFEAFIFRGKTYGYFGIGPALLRLPLILILNHDGQWSRVLMLTAFAINLLSAYRLLLLVRGPANLESASDRTLYSLFVLCAGIGSTNIFIINRSYTYHEAIMWSSTFALLCAISLLKYLAAPNLRSLTAAGLFAFMAFHSRATAGAGALLAMCIVTALLAFRAMHRQMLLRRSLRGGAGILACPDGASKIENDTESARTSTSSVELRGRNAPHLRIPGRQECLPHQWIGLPPTDRPMRHALVAGAFVIFTLGVYFGVNYGKFRTFDGVPVQYYNLYIQTPGRMQVTGGRQIHPENIPTTLASYLGFRGASIRPQFPWIYLSRQPSFIGSPAVDVVEQFSSIPVSMPALGLLAILGAMAVLRGQTPTLRAWRLPTFALFAGGGVIFMTVGITERYLHDVYPFLIIAGAAGLARLMSGEHRRRVTALLATLTIISIATNCAFAIEYQRIAVWGVPAAKRVEFHQTQITIDYLLHRESVAAEGN